MDKFIILQNHEISMDGEVVDRIIIPTDKILAIMALESDAHYKICIEVISQMHSPKIYTELYNVLSTRDQRIEYILSLFEE